jgi:threonyl-tRNA synthetase
MLHRAILGSFERFIGILIEHHAGRFPLWLAPVLAVVATIVSDADDYARRVLAALEAAGLRAEGRSSKREDQLQGARAQPRQGPNLLVLGKREAEEGTVALRRLGTEGRQEVLKLEELVERLRTEALPPDLRSS